jgi:flagellar M-ring protein FliF
LNKLFSSLIVQFREFFKSMGPTKRMAVMAATVVAMVSGLLLFYMISGKDFETIARDIPADQVPMMVDKLNKLNVPFKIGSDGKSVAVPKDQANAIMMTLSTELGSSKMGTLGLEIFDKQDFGVNSYAQKINYQRALQGELMRSINTLTSVKQSKVILALPNKKTFLEEGGQASASVVVELHPGKVLGEDQIRGIRYLVGSAVENLDPDRVTVVDERGKMLSRHGDGVASGTTEILDLKTKIEGDMEERIESILSRVTGHGKVIARVDVQLNNKVVQAVEESVDPEKTAIRSLQSEEESLDGARTNPTGVPGSRSNLPGAEDTAGQVGFNQNVKKEIKTTNYEVPKTVRNIKEAAGALEKISVAVLVDGVETTTTSEDGKAERKWSPRSAEEIQKYESLVKNAIGFNANRGDAVKIENIQFIAEDFSESDKIVTTLERRKLVHALFKWTLLGFSFALFFFIVVRPFMQWITDSFQDSVEDMLPRTIEELEELQSVDSTLPGMSSALPVLEESMDPDKAESELLKDRIMAIMENDSEKAQNAYGMWLVRKDG